MDKELGTVKNCFFLLCREFVVNKFFLWSWMYFAPKP